MDTSELLRYIGGGIAFLNLCWFAGKVYALRVSPQSPSSWVMWVVLDGVLAAATAKAGKPIWLPFGFMLGAALVSSALFKRGEWQWSRRDSFCAFCAACAAVVWVTQPGVYGVIAGVLAMYAASAPLSIDLFRAPIRGMRTMFLVTALGSSISLLGSDGTFAGVLFPIMSVIFNSTMAWIVSRRVVAAPV